MVNVVCKFLHTRMRVSDLDESVSFYEKVFGLEVSRRHESPRGSKLVFFIRFPTVMRRSSSLIFPGSGQVAVQEDLMHLAFEVESMSEFEAHTKSVGVPLSDGPTQSSSGSIFAFVDAPDGYEIEVIQRP